MPINPNLFPELSKALGAAAPPTGIQVIAPAEALARSERNSDNRNSGDDTPKPEITNLAAHVRKCWEAALSARTSAGADGRTLGDEFLQASRQRAGIYEAAKLAQIRLTGGSDTFHNITDTKCVAATSWCNDVMLPQGDKSFSIDHTPVADLPEDVTRQIAQRAVQAFQEQAMADVQALNQPQNPQIPGGLPQMQGAGGLSAPAPDPTLGQMPGPQVVPPPSPNGDPNEPAMMRLWDIANDLRDQELAAANKEARERAKRMEEKIWDQLTEGGYKTAMSEFLNYLVTYKYAVMKHEVRMKKRSKWDGDRLVMTEEPILCFDAINPQDVYFSPNSRSPQSGYICELVTMDKAALSEARGLPGWNTPAIERVLAGGGGPSVRLGLAVQGDSERRAMEFKDAVPQLQYGEEIVDGVEWWGACRADCLTDWGMDPKVVGDDPFAYVEICALLIGNEVVRAVLNPHILGHRPYKVTSFEKMPGSIYGKGIPEKMRDCQESYNGTMRALQNNVAMASGPMGSVDLSGLSPEDAADPRGVRPFRMWCHEGNTAGSDYQPVRWFQPQLNSAALIQIAEYFDTQADDRTMIPRYGYGNENVSGAASTASGLSQLMDSNAKGVKQILKNVDDDVQSTTIEDVYLWNLQHLPDEEWAQAKGDCRVSAHGALGVLLMDQTQMRRQEFLDRIVASQTLTNLLGMRKLGALLRSVAGGLKMPVDDVVPTDKEIEAQAQQQAQLEAQQQMAAMDAQRAALMSDGEPNAGNPGGLPSLQTPPAQLPAPPQAAFA